MTGVPVNWKSPVDLAKDFMGTVAYVGQAVFAPWTLPGHKFSTRPSIGVRSRFEEKLE